MHRQRDSGDSEWGVRSLGSLISPFPWSFSPLVPSSHAFVPFSGSGLQLAGIERVKLGAGFRLAAQGGSEVGNTSFELLAGTGHLTVIQDNAERRERRQSRSWG